ncbi:MAG: hypothetical protein Q8942_06670 [Bacillota bacterium]|nr:hypothetical protein [Bacillota bacterium]
MLLPIKNGTFTDTIITDNLNAEHAISSKIDKFFAILPTSSGIGKCSVGSLVSGGVVTGFISGGRSNRS